LRAAPSCDWCARLEAATRRRRTVLDQGPGRLGVVFNATSPNEDLYALAKLAFDHLGVGKAYLAGRDQGWSDKILVSGDKNPNTAGGPAVGAARLKTLVDLAGDLKSGALGALLMLGTEGVLVG